MEYIVTSLSDSGTGSLREAIEQAVDYYRSNDEDVVITFAEELEGTVSLDSPLETCIPLTIACGGSKRVTIDGLVRVYGYSALRLEEGMGISGTCWIERNSRLCLNGATLDGGIYLDEGAWMEGEGNTFTKRATIFIAGDNSGSGGGLNWGGCIIDEWLEEKLFYATAQLRDSVFEGGRMRVGAYMPMEGDLVLPELWNICYNVGFAQVNAGQTLTANGAWISGDISVEDGGAVRFSGVVFDGCITLVPGAVLEGSGNTFTDSSAICLSGWRGATADALPCLESDYRPPFRVNIGVGSITGDAELSSFSGTPVRYWLRYLYAGESGLVSYGYVDMNSGQTLTAQKGVMVSGACYVRKDSTLILNGAVVDSTIWLEPGATLQGSGNTFTKRAHVWLEHWRGSTADTLSGFTHSDLGSAALRVYITVSDDTVLSAIPGVYYDLGNVYVYKGDSLTVEEGVEFCGECHVRDGGTLRLDGAIVDGEIYLEPGAVLVGTGNTFTGQAALELRDWSGSVADAWAGIIEGLDDTVFESDSIKLCIGSISGDTVLSAIPGVEYELGSSRYYDYLHGNTLTVEKRVRISGAFSPTDSGVLQLNGAIIDGSITVSPNVMLRGDGNTFTENAMIRLGALSGSSAEAWAHATAGLTNSVYESGRLRIGVSSLSGDAVLNAIPGAGYDLSCYVRDGYTLTVEEGVEITGSFTVRNGSTLRMDSTVVDGEIRLEQGALLEGDGNTFTSQAIISLESLRGSTADSWAQIASGLTNSVFEDERLRMKIKTLSGDSVLSSMPGVYYDLECTVDKDRRLTVEEDVTISGCCTVDNGSTLKLNGAVVDGEIRLDAHAKLVGSGNTFTRQAVITLDNLTNSSSIVWEEVMAGLSDSVFEDGEIRIGIGSLSGYDVLTSVPGAYYVLKSSTVYDKGFLWVDGVKITGSCSVANGGVLRLSDATIDGTIGLSYDALISGWSNVFTRNAKFKLENLSGSTAAVWNRAVRALSDSVFESGEIHFVVDELCGDTVLSAIPDAYYELSCEIHNKRTLKADGAKITGNCTVLCGGTLQLQGATVDGRLTLYSGAMLEGESNIFTDRAVIVLKNAGGSISDIWAKATAGLNDSVYESGRIRIGISSLCGNTVLDTIADACYDLSCEVGDGTTLTVEEGVTVCGDIHIGAGASFVMENAYLPDDENLSLTIDKACGHVKISGCDLSKTEVALIGSGGGVIDLSGNYWGEADIDAIKARISGYEDNTVILDDILLSDPAKTFAVLGTNLKKNTLSALATEFSVLFSHKIDAATVDAARMRLVDSKGNDVAFTVEVQGKELRFHLASPVTTDGRLYLYLGKEIKDLAGQTYMASTNAEYDLKLTCDMTPPRVDHVTPSGDFAGAFSSFSIYFTGAVDIAGLSPNVWLEKPDGDTVAVSSVKMLSDSSACFYVARQLTYGTYTIHVGADVCDYAGNKLDQNGNGIGGEADDAFTATFNLTEIDLSITDVSLNDFMTAGTVGTVSWVGKNATEYALAGSWTDGVYLSSDTKWDIKDVKLGTYTHTGGLAAGESYAGSLSFSVPSVVPGSYYLLVRSDVYGQEKPDKAAAQYAQNLMARRVYIGMTELDKGGSVQGTLTKADACDYYVVKSGGSEAIRLTFDGFGDGAKAEVYVGYGKVPTREKFDKKYKVDSSGASILLLGDSSSEDLYIRVNKQAGSEDCSYTMTADFKPVAITGVTPGIYNVGGVPVFDIYGINFSSDSQVELVAEDGSVYSPESVTWVSSGRLIATFSEGVLPAGKLDVRVSAHGETCESPDAVEMVATGGAHFLLDTKAPGSLGYHMVSTIRVNFENVGWETMDAPLVFVTVEQKGQQKAMLTTDASKVNQGFWTAVYPEGFSTSISFLAANTGAGTLSPTGSFWQHYTAPAGGSASMDSSTDTADLKRKDSAPLQNSVDIYYTGWLRPWDFSYPKFEVKVSYLTTDNTIQMDWEGLLEQSSFSASEKASLAKSLPETVGTTVGDFVKYMDRTLAYLDGLGVETSGLEMKDLMLFCLKNVLRCTTSSPILASAVDMVHSSSDMELAVYRAFGSDLVSRNVDGAFGYGWSFNWDLYLEEKEDGSVAIKQDGLICTLQPDYRGGYVGLADGSSLKKNRDGGYVLSNADAGKMVFAADGRIHSVSAADGASLSFSYDASGNLEKIASSSGESISFEWEDGHIVRLQDGKGNTNNYSYKDGNLVSMTSSNGDTVRYEYGSEWQHALTATIGKDGTRYEYSYNQYGLLENSSLSAADGSVSAYAGIGTSYGEFGEVTLSDVFGNMTTCYYDHLGLIRRAVDVDGNTVNYGYDADGNLTWMMDQSGRLTKYTYDADGNMLSFTDASGDTTYYSYTHDGALACITDANGNTIRYEHDANGYTSAIIYDDGTRESYVSDADGRLLFSASRSGKENTLTYDDKGNMLGATYSDSSTLSFTYNEDDRLVTMTASSGDTVSFTYDERGNLTSVDYGNGQVLLYEYSSDDQLASMTDENGRKTCYNYDALGRLTRVSEADGSLIVAYEYDLAGQITKSTNGNGTYTEYTYTKSGKAECVTNYAPDGSVQSFSRNIYNSVGLCISRESQDVIWSYEYDASGRLLHAVFTPVEGNGIQAQELLYEYDAVGNRTRSVVNGVETIYTNNSLNQTVSAGDAVIEYDADGNLIRKTDSSGVTTYEYNAIGKLSRMVTATGSVHEYSYNALGQRVAVTVDGVTTRYVYDLAGNLLNTYDANGNLSASYRYGYNLLGYGDASDHTYYYQGDILGSVAGTTDASGNLISLRAYSPFGECLSSTSTAGSDEMFGWLGQYGLQSDASGQVYMNARYYDPFTGTFTQADPIGVQGGLNLYAYCGNNPVSYVDPSGTVTTCDFIHGAMMGLGAAAGVVLLASGGAALGFAGAIAGGAVGLVAGFIVNAAISGGVGWDPAVRIKPVAKTYIPNGVYEDREKFLGIVPYVVHRFIVIDNVVYDYGHNEKGFRQHRVDIRQFSKKEFPEIYLVQGLDPKLTREEFERIIGLPISSVPDRLINDTKSQHYMVPMSPFPRSSLYARYQYSEYDMAINNCISFTDAVMGLLRSTGYLADSMITRNLYSSDPNDLIGPMGYGESNFISTQGAMSFMLEFENEAEATAPTHWIRLTNVFDEAFDLDSFTLDAFCLGGNYMNVTDGLDSFNQLVEMEFEGKKVQVQVSINLDYEERTLSAEFMAVDPETGFMIQDPEIGMLFPEDGTSRGMGYVTYDISLKQDLATGTTVSNQADIYFDFNDVIPTPEITYTIDADGPTSRITGAEDLGGGKVQLTWEGADAEGGAGLFGFYIFASKDGGAFEHVGSFTADTTSGVFSGEAGSTYSFYTVAVDNVGNLEDSKSQSEATLKLKCLTASTKGKKVTFKWPAVAGAKSYSVRMVNAKGKVTVKKASKATLTATLSDSVYSWTVTALDKKGKALEVMTGGAFQVDSTAPTKVTKLAASPVDPGEGNTAILLTWAASKDVSDIRYRVEYSTNKSFKKGTVQTIEVDYGAELAVELPVQAGKYVYYRVTAVDSFGNKSKAVSGSYAQPTIAPASVQAVKISGKKATFSWEAVEGAKSYIVKIKNAKGKVVTKTFKTNSGVVSLGESVYTWTVQAVSAAGVKSAVTAAQDSFFMDLTAPTKVTKLAAAPVDPGEGNTAILLTWAASKDASDIRYRVEYSTNKSFKKGTVQTIEVDYGAELAVELPVQAGKYVYYRVTAVDSYGNKSKTVSGSYAQPTIAPASVEQAVVSGKKVTLAWAAAEGATSYIVKLTDAKGKVTTKTFKTNSGVVSLGESTYTWTVQAVSAAGVKSAVTAAEGGDFLVDVTAPTAVTKLSASQNEGQVTLKWTASKDTSALRYKVQYSHAKDFSSILGEEEGVTGTTCTLELAGTDTLYYRVMAVDAAGHESKWTTGSCSIAPYMALQSAKSQAPVMVADCAPLAVAYGMEAPMAEPLADLGLEAPAWEAESAATSATAPVLSVDQELALSAGVDYLQTPVLAAASGYEPAAATGLELQTESTRRAALLASPIV